jgi:hypothetical protein
VTSRIDRANAEGRVPAALVRERQRLEGAIRARAMHAAGGVPTGARDLDVPALLSALGDTLLVQIVEIGGRLRVLVCGDGRVRGFAAGGAAAARREVDFARFRLNRMAHNRSATGLDALEIAGRRLQEALLGEAADRLGDRPVVIVPPGSLHAVPWALLPALRERDVGVAPSAAAWSRAAALPPPEKGSTVYVRGPGLVAGEVATLAREQPDAVALGSGTALADDVLAALDGAGLAHIAAHGVFRADSPMFSSLLMDDGPLTVHDFERLSAAPYRLILPSCESAVLSPAGADELLGLTSTLLPLGTAGIVASVVPVDDEAVVPLILALHRRLRAGATLARALNGARRECAEDAAQLVAGWSFIALGAA